MSVAAPVAVDRPRARRRGDPPRVPGARAPGPRQAALLPRQRRLEPAAAARHRRRVAYYETLARQRAPRRAHPEPGSHRPLRGRAREACAASSTRARRARSSSCAARPRRSTSSPRATRGRGLGARRRDPGLLRSSTTRTSCPGRWSASRPARGCASIPIDAVRRGGLRGLPRAARRAHAPGGARPRVERARHRPAGAALHRRGAPRTACPCCSTARRPCRTCAVDVQELDCDFYCFSGHKMCGPTGIGVLYGREALLAAMPPWQGGGDMILAVSFERTTYNDLPCKFEAGTPHIAGAIGLGAAIDYLEELGLDRIAAARARAARVRHGQRCPRVDGLEIVGTAPDKAAVVSFTLEGIHPHDLGTILDMEGVAIRTGHHCAMPVMEFYGVPATARASFAFYNTRAEVDRAGRRRCASRRRCSADGPARPLSRRDRRSQPQSAQFPRRCRTPTATRTASTRCAATG